MRHVPEPCALSPRAVALICAAIAVAMLLALPGCTRTVYLPAETVRTVSNDRAVATTVADSVSDTRLIWVRGDTVTLWRDRVSVRRVEVHDTTVIERTDSVSVPCPVERTLTRWERAKMDFGGMALGAVGAAVAALIVWLIIKFRRR